jgi:hypothetical protein
VRRLCGVPRTPVVVDDEHDGLARAHRIRGSTR